MKISEAIRIGKEVSYKGYRRFLLDPTTDKIKFIFMGFLTKIVGCAFYYQNTLVVWMECIPTEVNFNTEITLNFRERENHENRP